MNKLSQFSQRVILKPGKEKAILHRHHWIFSGAIATLPPFEEGQILPVYSSHEELLGHAYFNHKGSIRGRMVSFGDYSPQVAIIQYLKEAIQLRQRFFKKNETNAYRLVNGEGDCLSGLVIDQYGDFLVIQLATQGMERLRAEILQFLVEQKQWKGIYEKSKMPTRKEEGLKDREGWLWGIEQAEIPFIENQIHFLANPVTGQKTGFFLDQREMRKQIGLLAHQKRILNCFSYTGGFSLYALKQGAAAVTSVDISAPALETLTRQIELNQLDSHRHTAHHCDVFQFLHEKPLNYDIVILDPPAFTKRKEDVVAACRGYKEINRKAFEKMPKGSLLLTCSCSYHVDATLFQQVVFQAAHDAKRAVRIIGKHCYAVDHPINLHHPEGDYLKSLLLYIQ